MPKKVGLVWPGGFKNLAPHVGGAAAYFHLWEKGLVPRPSFVTGSSAGAIVAVISSPWTEKVLEQGVSVITHLTEKQIYRLRRITELLGLLNIAESFSNFISPPRRWQPWAKLLFETGKSMLSLGTKGATSYELLHHPSIFSSQPVRQLLQRNLEPLFPLIWGTEAIPLEISAVNLEMACSKYFSNFRSEDCQRTDRNERLLNFLLGSISIPAFLEKMVIDGQLMDDAAILNNAPIERAVLMGCEIIIFFQQSPFQEKQIMPPEKTRWMEELARALDLSIKEHTRKRIDWHCETNADVVNLEELKIDLQSIPFSAEQKTLLEKRLSRFSFAQKKPVQIIKVISAEKIPDINFQKFDQDNLFWGVNLGYEAARDTLLKKLDLFK